MKSEICRLCKVLSLVGGSGGSAVAGIFTIEKNDLLLFCIHLRPDEKSATKKMLDEFADEIKRVTGVEPCVLGYASAFAGDIHVSSRSKGRRVPGAMHSARALSAFTGRIRWEPRRHPATSSIVTRKACQRPPDA